MEELNNNLMQKKTKYFYKNDNENQKKYYSYIKIFQNKK